MSRSLPKTVCITLVLIATSVVAARTQQPKTPETNATPAAAATQAPAPTTPPIARYDRLAAAKTIYIKNVSDNDIAYNVISTACEGWGRYLVVDDPDKAEIVMEIVVTGGEESGVKVSDSTKNSVHAGQPHEDHSASKEIAPQVIKVTVLDKNKRPLWFAREEPKFAVRHKAADNNLVEAAQRLFARFHDRVEPPPKP